MRLVAWEVAIRKFLWAKIIDLVLIVPRGAAFVMSRGIVGSNCQESQRIAKDAKVERLILIHSKFVRQ